MKSLILLIVAVGLLAGVVSAEDDDGFRRYPVGCGHDYRHDDYAVSYTFEDGYTWAHVWYHGQSTTIMGTAGFQIGNSDGSAEWVAPDGQLVLVGAYPDDHYDEVVHVGGCTPVDDTDDAFPIETEGFDPASGRPANVYIFAGYVLGERTEIPAEVDASRGLRITLQVDQWMPGMRYAVLVNGVYAGSFVLGDVFGEIDVSMD